MENITIDTERDDFLSLAFKSLELSYEIPDKKLCFLSLMIGLEILLNPSDHELQYRVSRNAAVLLGKNEEGSRRIFDDIKKLYNLRSKIVHGDETPLTDDDVSQLRFYVKESIKAVHTLNMKKNDLMKILSESGFGNSPLKK